MGNLVPDNPSEVMVIRQVTSNISTLSVPFARFGRIQIGGRATIVRLPSSALAVFSPVALTEEVRAHISALGAGPVRYLVAPDMEHHIFLSAWSAAFPDAKLIGPSGLPEKRARQANKPAEFDVVYPDDLAQPKPSVDAEFDAEFDVEYIPSHPNKELVFLHRRDRTLLEADMLFNLPATEQYSRVPESHRGNIWSTLFGAAQTTDPKLGATWQKRFIWYGFSARDRPAFNASVARIAAWDFDRIIPCHGDVIEKDGKEVWKRMFAWNIDMNERGNGI